MSLSYTTYNCVFALAAAAASAWVIRSRAQWRAVLQTALFFTVLAYPWDFFAITLGTWAHPPDVGIRIYSVPVNDLVLLFFATIYSAGVLSKPTGTPTDANPTPRPKIDASRPHVKSDTD
jgi:lycopene cyclase domain-containing protein